MVIPIDRRVPHRRQFRLRKSKPKAHRYYFNHGIGDALMLRSVLPLVPYSITLAMPWRRRYDELFKGFDRVTVETVESIPRGYEYLKMYPEDSCVPVYSGRPIKTRMALELDFEVLDQSGNIKPLPLDLSQSDRPEAHEMRERINALGGPYVVVSGHGASSPKRKDCPITLVDRICAELRQCGLLPVVINFGDERRYPDSLLTTAGWPEAESALWLLLANAQGLVGIDSGPMHMALTIDGLRCVYLHNKIDFRRSFYDSGMDQIQAVIDVKQEQTQRDLMAAIKTIL